MFFILFFSYFFFLCSFVCSSSDDRSNYGSNDNSAIMKMPKYDVIIVEMQLVIETNLLPFSKLKLIVLAKVNAFQLISKKLKSELCCVKLIILH